MERLVRAGEDAVRNSFRARWLVCGGNADPRRQGEAGPQSLYPAWMCGADFAALLSKQYDEFGRVIREANIRRIELALRNFQRTSVCFGSWLCENSSGRATRRNISGQLHPWESNHTAHARFDDLLEKCVFYILRMYEFLHRVGQKPPWRHVASNVRFAPIRRATRSPRRRGPGYSGGTSRPRAREVFRLIMRLNWSAARSVAHPAACLLSVADHLRDYRHAPFPLNSSLRCKLNCIQRTRRVAIRRTRQRACRSRSISPPVR